ncbi:MAG: MmgE/PrpD family protein, partial [Xanthobacteraceae bacterium]
MLRNSAPQTGLEAKFSMQFAMAAALVARDVGLQELTDGFVRRAEVQALFPRVFLEGTAVIKEGSNFAPFDAVEITTTGGETFKSGPVEYAKGSHERPLSRDELWTKFAECLGAQFPETKKSRAFENLMMFDRLNGAGDLALQIA